MVFIHRANDIIIIIIIIIIIVVVVVVVRCKKITSGFFQQFLTATKSKTNKKLIFTLIIYCTLLYGTMLPYAYSSRSLCNTRKSSAVQIGFSDNFACVKINDPKR